MTGRTTQSGSVSAAGPGGAGNGLRILVVEDSELDARVLISLLRQGGYAVSWKRVASGDAMLAALRSEPWDAILCDHSMPGFSAPEALSLLQQTGLDIPFLIVSAGIGEDVAVAAMKAGANDFLIKGNLARLVPAVEREIRDAEVRAARRAAEAGLRESELRHRLVWENSADAVLLLDDEGVIRFANPAIRTIFDWDPDEVIGATLDRFQPEGAPAGSWWNSRHDSGRPLSDTPGRRRDGASIDLDIAFSQLNLNERPLFAAFIRDISERKKTEAELRKTRAEFAAAREIQQRLFPRHSPDIEGFDIAGASHPADAAGGDYFDFPVLHGGRPGLLVADVSGHGIGPALLMAEARTCVRLIARQQADPAGVLTLANEALAEDLDPTRYITLLLVAVDPGTRTATFASAGHPAAYHLDAAGNLKAELRRTGPPLGQRPRFTFTNGPAIHLAPGDTLILITDGIIESSHGQELFGRDRLLKIVREHGAGSARDLVTHICGKAREFAFPEAQSDDLTAVVLKVSC